MANIWCRGQKFKGVTILSATNSSDNSQVLFKTTAAAASTGSPKIKVFGKEFENIKALVCQDADSEGIITFNYAGGTVLEKLATPTISLNSDGKTLEIVDVEHATNYKIYVDGVLKTTIARN